MSDKETLIAVFDRMLANPNTEFGWNYAVRRMSLVGRSGVRWYAELNGGHQEGRLVVGQSLTSRHCVVNLTDDECQRLAKGIRDTERVRNAVSPADILDDLPE